MAESAGQLAGDVSTSAAEMPRFAPDEGVLLATAKTPVLPPTARAVISAIIFRFMYSLLFRRMFAFLSIHAILSREGYKVVTLSPILSRHTPEGNEQILVFAAKPRLQAAFRYFQRDVAKAREI